MEKGEGDALKEAKSLQAQHDEVDTIEESAFNVAANNPIETQDSSIVLPVLADTINPSATPNITRTEIPDSDAISDFSSPVKTSSINLHLTAASPPRILTDNEDKRAAEYLGSRAVVQDEAPATTANRTELPIDVPDSSPPFMIGFTSSAMTQIKQATAIAFAAAAVGELDALDFLNNDKSTDQTNTTSDEAGEVDEVSNHTSVLTSLPELEFIRTYLEPDSTSSEDDIIVVDSPLVVVPYQLQTEDQPAAIQADLSVSFLEVGIEENKQTPVELPDDDSQHFKAAWREVMGTQKIDSSDITASQTTEVNGNSNIDADERHELPSTSHTLSNQMQSDEHTNQPVGIMSNDITNDNAYEDTSYQRVDDMVSGHLNMEQAALPISQNVVATSVNMETRKHDDLDTEATRPIISSTTENAVDVAILPIDGDSLLTFPPTPDLGLSEAQLEGTILSKDDVLSTRIMPDFPEATGRKELTRYEERAIAQEAPSETVHQQDDLNEVGAPNVLDAEQNKDRTTPVTSIESIKSSSGPELTNSVQVHIEPKNPNINLGTSLMATKETGPAGEADVATEAQNDPRECPDEQTNAAKDADMEMTLGLVTEAQTFQQTNDHGLTSASIISIEQDLPSMDSEETAVLVQARDDQVANHPKKQGSPAQYTDTEMTIEDTTDVQSDEQTKLQNLMPASVSFAEQDLLHEDPLESPMPKNFEILDSDDKPMNEAISFEQRATAVTNDTLPVDITAPETLVEEPASEGAALDSDDRDDSDAQTGHVIMTGQGEYQQLSKQPEGLLPPDSEIISQTDSGKTSKKRVIPDSDDDEDETEDEVEQEPSLPAPLSKKLFAISAETTQIPAITPTISESLASEIVPTTSSSQDTVVSLPSIRKQPVKTPQASFKLPSFSKDKSRDSLSSSPIKQASRSASPFASVVGEQMAEASGSTDVVLAELKAMKIASLKARNTALTAEIAAKRAKLEEVTKTLRKPAAETVKTHIKLLHDYNDIRDVGQGLIGMIADNRGVRIGELYEEFGVDIKD